SWALTAVGRSSGIARPQNSATASQRRRASACARCVRPPATTSSGPARRSKLCDNIRRVRRAGALTVLLALIGRAEARPHVQTEGQGRLTTAETTLLSPEAVEATIDRAYAFIDEHEPVRAERLLLPFTSRQDLTNRQRARARRALGGAYLALNRRTDAAEAF